MLKKSIAFFIAAGIACTPVMALAQHNDYHNNNYHDAHQQRYVRHNEWRRGYHMRSNDWSRAQRVDNWRAYHLSAPPRGYEWREVDGNYVLAAVATGIIASVIAASASH